jgi:hypothetical protein
MKLLFCSKNRERFVAKVVVFGEDREPMIKSPATRVVNLASLPKIERQDRSKTRRRQRNNNKKNKKHKRLRSSKKTMSREGRAFEFV